MSDMLNLSDASGGKVSLVDNGVFYLTGVIDEASTKEVIVWIMEHNLQQTNKFDYLTLIINSSGGELFSAFALIDVMQGSAIPIHTLGLGIIGSAALLIFISGKGGKRMITPNTSILSHQWTWGTWGKEHELMASRKQHELTTKRIITHYKKCTKLSDKVIKEKLLPPQDVWLDSDDALKYKLVDIVKTLG